MSGLGFTRSDICSISSIASQGRIAAATRGVLSADGNQLADDDRHELPASSIDRAIRLSTAAAVLAVAAIAAYVSYWHAYAVVRAHGETGVTARLEPATIDGLVYASSLVVLYAAQHRVPAPSLARWLLGVGIVATLTANMAQGESVRRTVELPSAVTRRCPLTCGDECRVVPKSPEIGQSPDSRVVVPD